jgi:hypothetical protein
MACAMSSADEECTRLCTNAQEARRHIAVMLRPGRYVLLLLFYKLCLSAQPL